MEITDREYQELSRKAQNWDSDSAADKRLAKLIVAGVVALILLVIGIVFMFKLVNPALNLRKANTEKQAVIKEQEAKSKAAEFEAKSAVTRATAEAEARVIEAQSIAESQEIIAATLTPEYLQWRYYEVLATTDNQIIYVPADGLPLTEAGRATTTPDDAG